MRIPTELRQLSRHFINHSPLYLVGGAVRDSFLGIQSNDFDIASSLTTHEVKTILKNSKFKICGEYPRTGTLVIVSNNMKCEYTTFRTDSYPSGRGDHSPQTVEFTTDINLDALRRDFTCNAIYYDIEHNSYIDPTNGITAIKNRLITTTRLPDLVLQEDALRILRIPRLSCELGFHVEPEVIASATKYANGLKHIPRERIGAEILKLLNCKRKYPQYTHCFNPSYGIALLEEIGVNNYIFGKNVSFTTLCQLDKLKKDGYYAYTVTMQLALIFLDYNSQEILSACENLALSKAQTAEIIGIVDAYNLLNTWDFNNLTYSDAKLMVAKIFDFVKPITAIKMARNESIDKLVEIAHILSNLNIPVKVSQLKINGRDVIDHGYKGVEIGEVIDYALKQSILQELTLREEQLKLITSYGGKK